MKFKEVKKIIFEKSNFIIWHFLKIKSIAYDVDFIYIVYDEIKEKRHLCEISLSGRFPAPSDEIGKREEGEIREIGFLRRRRTGKASKKAVENREDGE